MIQQMKRRLGKLAFLLILGAIVNVAVAWTGGTITDYAFMDAIDLDATDLGLLEGRCAGRDEVPLDSFGERRTNGVVTFVFLGECAIWKQGWPMRSMIGGSTDQREGILANAVLFRVIPAYLRKTPDFRRLSVIALEPLWPGFAANTLFYAGALWLLFATPLMLRRRRRARRGLCVTCGYDLRGIESGKCPECGVGRNRISGTPA